MKRNILTITLLAALLQIFPHNLGAQGSALATGYFNDGYIYKNRINPALTANMSYTQFPALNLFVSSQSSLALKDFIFFDQIKDGKYQTFFSPGLPAETALRVIRPVNEMSFSLDDAIWSGGFWSKSGRIFTTVECGVHVDEYSKLPYDLFALLRNAAPDGSYSLANTCGSGSASSYLSLGMSFRLGSKVRFGYRVKFMNSLASASVNVGRMDIFVPSADSQNGLWSASGSVDIKYQLPFTIEENGNMDGFFNDPDFLKDRTVHVLRNAFRSFGISGDLGINIDILDWLAVSASVNDLGVMSYGDVYSVSLDFDLNSADGVKPDGIYTVRNNGVTHKCAAMPDFYAHAGLQIRIPVYQKISFGALYSQRFSPNASSGWWETRLSLNYDLLKWLSLSASYANGTYGNQLGAMLTLHTKGLNLFVGADSIPFQYISNGMAYDSLTCALHFGLAFQFGRYFGRYN